jgi:hypothetical protein
MSMRKIVFTGLALAAILAALPGKGKALYKYPWCAQFADGSGIFSCAFATFNQCLAAVSGHRRVLHAQSGSRVRSADSGTAADASAQTFRPPLITLICGRAFALGCPP